LKETVFKTHQIQVVLAKASSLRRL